MAKVYEVEVKRQLTSDKEAFTTQLLQNGYVESAVVVEVDDYYSRPDVDYMKTVECLRIRDTGKKREITYKPPTTDFSATTIIKEEKNIPLASAEDVDVARDLLRAIGMVHLVKVEKHRQSYAKSYNDHEVTITIDVLPGVGDFVEIEILSTDPAAAQSAITEVEAELSLDSLPIETLPYRDIVMNSEKL